MQGLHAFRQRFAPAPSLDAEVTARMQTARMPEGPSIVLLREQCERFVGRRILGVEGSSAQDIGRLERRTVRAVRS